MMRLSPILLIVLLFGCHSQAGQNNKNPLEAPDQEDIERFIGTQLPVSASNIQLAKQEGLDTTVYVRFSIRPDELPLFLNNLGFTVELRDLFAIVPTVSSGGRPSWWFPDDIESYAAEEAIINGKAYQVAVDKTDSQQWVVYLMVFTIG